MIGTCTLPDMDKNLTLRQLAGSIVRDEMARQHLDQVRTAALAHMGRSTLSKIVNGTDEKVTPTMLRSVEGALGMPRHLLTAIIAGDIERVEEMVFEDADLKRHVLTTMRQVQKVPKPRRGSRHSA